MFTGGQSIWITLEYAKNPSSTIVKRELVRKYNICGRQNSKYYPHHFTRVSERFKGAASPQRFIPEVKFLKQLFKQSS